MALALVVSALLLSVVYAAIWHYRVRAAIRRAGSSDARPSAEVVERPADEEEELARRRRVAVAASDPRILG